MPIDVYASLKKDGKRFARMSGLKKELFENLLIRVVTKIEERKEEHRIRKRGIKPIMSVENKLLLMLLYYREYHTYLSISAMFGISESYACKLIHRMADIVVDTLPLGGKRIGWNADIKSVLLDASEQPIERPQRKQRQYYSGKKNAHH